MLRFIYGTMQNGYSIVVFGGIPSHDYQVQYNYGTSQVWSISTELSLAFGVEMLLVRNVSLTKGF